MPLDPRSPTRSVDGLPPTTLVLAARELGGLLVHTLVLTVLSLTGCISVTPESELLREDGTPIHTCPEDPGLQSNRIENQSVDADEEADELAAELLDRDRITVVTCGTGAPLPSDRAQTCTAVFVAGQFFLFDLGDRAQPSVEALGLPITDLDAIFVTHFHSDHIADLGEAISRSWIIGRTDPLTVYGPEGIDPIVTNFLEIYSEDVVYRNEHHGPTVFPEPELRTSAVTIEHSPEGTVAYDRDGVTVKAYTVAHDPVEPSVGYRVEYRGRAVGISGDTIDSEGLRALAMDADVLVSEVLDHNFVRDAACGLDRAGDERNATIFRDIRDYHIGAETLGRVAEETGVETLMLTHMVPSQSPRRARDRFQPLIKAGGFTRELIVSEDGSMAVLELD